MGGSIPSPGHGNPHSRLSQDLLFLRLVPQERSLNWAPGYSPRGCVRPVCQSCVSRPCLVGILPYLPSAPARGLVSSNHTWEQSQALLPGNHGVRTPHTVWVGDKLMALNSVVFVTEPKGIFCDDDV